MNGRLKGLGVVLAVIGLAFVAGGGFALYKTNQGAQALQALQAFSSAQNVKLAYSESGQLLDRGTPEGAQAIMSLLVNDWGYQVASSELDARDPLVNTASEYMFQMATIAYHTLNSTQTVVLDKAVSTRARRMPRGRTCSRSTAATGRVSIDPIRSKGPRVRRPGPEPRMR